MSEDMPILTEDMKKKADKAEAILREFADQSPLILTPITHKWCCIFCEASNDWKTEFQHDESCVWDQAFDHVHNDGWKS